MDNECSHNWYESSYRNHGFCEHVHTRAGSGQSLSCTHGSHSGSRDIHRGLGGLLWKVGFVYGSLRARTLTAEAPGNVLLLFCFIFIKTFNIFLIFLYFLFYCVFKNYFPFNVLLLFVFCFLCFFVLFCIGFLVYAYIEITKVLLI